jgi:hypothetical protein
MSTSQIGAAVARCWIDEETHVRKPRSSDWTKLGDAVPDKKERRLTEEPVATDIRGDVETSAMLILSGEYEVVSDTKKKELETSAMVILSGEYEVVSQKDDQKDDAPLTKEELSSARPPRVGRKIFALAVLLVAGGSFAAHRYVPGFDARVHAMTTTAMSSLRADLGPAPTKTAPPSTPVVASPPPVATPAPPVVAPAPSIVVSGSATTYIVPKMRAPTPPPPLPPEPAPKVAAKSPTPSPTARAAAPAKPAPRLSTGPSRDHAKGLKAKSSRGAK